MSSLIYFFDGGGKQIMELGITFLISVLAIWYCLSKDSPIRELSEGDDGENDENERR